MLKKCCAILFVPFVLCFSSVPLSATEAEDQLIPPHRNISTIEKIKEVDYAVFLIQKRLSIMHEVARWKWNTKTEIEDPVREGQILKKIGKLAVAYGLNREWTIKFFQAQMDASKMIQSHDFEYWNNQNVGEFEEVADLHGEIRPYLDRLTKELLDALVKISPYLKQSDMEAFLLEQPLSTRRSDSVDGETWQVAIAPLYEYSP